MENMENINGMMNFADIMASNDNLKPIIDLVEQIMEIPEENLNEENVDIISGMIEGAFTKNMRKELVKGALSSFEENNFDQEQAARLVEKFKEEVESLINSYTPSKNKYTLLNSIFKPMQDMFEQAVLQYHGYAFELPIKLDKGAQLPTYAHDTDACADLYAVEDMIIPAHSLSNMVHTGIRIALPESWVFLIDPRSSIGLKSGLRLSNSIGIVDEDYRGEICVLYDNISDSDYEIKAGDRIAQCWVQQVHRFKPVAVNELPTTERGEGGFGSTGK